MAQNRVAKTIAHNVLAGKVCLLVIS